MCALLLGKFSNIEGYMEKTSAKRKKIFDPKKRMRYKNRALTPETDRHFNVKRRGYAFGKAALGMATGAALGSVAGDPAKGAIYGYLAGGAGGYLYYPHTYGGEEKKASAPRDYKREYRLFHSSPEAKRNRAKRNLWNRRLKGKVPAGYEIDHKRQLRDGGGNGRDNIRFMRVSKNRAEHNRSRVLRDHMRKESSALMGAGIGAVGLGGIAALEAPKGKKLESAIKGGIVGGALGGGIGALHKALPGAAAKAEQALSKTSSAPPSELIKRRRVEVDRDKVKGHLSKTRKGFGAVLGGGLGALAGGKLGRAGMAIGAAAGAGLGYGAGKAYKPSERHIDAFIRENNLDNHRNFDYTDIEASMGGIRGMSGSRTTRSDMRKRFAKTAAKRRKMTHVHPDKYNDSFRLGNATGHALAGGMLGGLVGGPLTGRASGALGGMALGAVGGGLLGMHRYQPMSDDEVYRRTERTQRKHVKPSLLARLEDVHPDILNADNETFLSEEDIKKEASLLPPLLGTDRVYSWAAQMEKVAKSRVIKAIEASLSRAKAPGATVSQSTAANQQALKRMTDLERAAGGSRAGKAMPSMADQPRLVRRAREILADGGKSEAAKKRAQSIVEKYERSFASGDGSIAQREIKGFTDQYLGHGEQGVVEPTFYGGREAVRKRLHRNAGASDVQGLRAEANNSVELERLIKQDTDLNRLVTTPEYLAANQAQTGLVGQGRATMTKRMQEIEAAAPRTPSGGVDIAKLPKAQRREYARLKDIQARANAGEDITRFTRGQTMPMGRVDMGTKVTPSGQNAQHLRNAKARNILEERYNVDLYDHNMGGPGVANAAYGADGRPIMYDFGRVGRGGKESFRSEVFNPAVSKAKAGTPLTPGEAFGVEVTAPVYNMMDQVKNVPVAQLAPSSASHIFIPNNNLPLPKLQPMPGGKATSTSKQFAPNAPSTTPQPMRSTTGTTNTTSTPQTQPKQPKPLHMQHMYGAGGGALLGAGVGAVQGGEGNRISGALGGAMVGGALGAGGATGYQVLGKGGGIGKAASVAVKRDPAKWETAKREAKAKMGGKHSARAMQLATQIYKKKGGTYAGKKPSPSSNKLRKWTKQKWEWSGGDTPGEGGKGVYLPKRSAEQLSSTKSGRAKLRRASRIKRGATSRGQQFSSHGLHVGKKRSATA